MRESTKRALSTKDKAMLEMMSKPLDQWDHNMSQLSRYVRQDLKLQLNHKGEDETGKINAWPKLKESYERWKIRKAKTDETIRYGGRRIMILRGALEKALPAATVDIEGSAITVEWATDVQSEDGFDYPSYWQGQNGPLSPVHNGFRPFMATKRLVETIGKYLIQRLNVMARGLDNA